MRAGTGRARRRLLVTLSVGVIVAAALGLQALIAVWQGPAIAADAPPVASRQMGGNAGQIHTPTPAGVTWTVGDLLFESRYPEGFAFRAAIASSAGPIVRGRVIWSHVPGTQRSRPIEVDPVSGTLRARWDAGVGDSVPPWVGVTYWWDVGDAAGNSFQTEPVYVEYADESRPWLRTESDDIIVFSTGLPEAANQLTMEAMAAQRETYRAAWGDLLPYKPRAILFGDRATWAEWRGVTSGAVIGLTSDDWGGTAQVVASYGNLNELAYGTVLHEVAHLYQAAFTLMTPGTWLIEGNATFFEIDRQYDYLGTVRTLARSGQLPVLLDGSGPGVSGRSARRGYDIGYSFFVWLTETYGLEAHRTFVALLDRGIGRNAALEAVTGLPAQEIESRWRVWLGASPIVPTLIPTPTLLVFPSPTPFTPGR